MDLTRYEMLDNRPHLQALAAIAVPLKPLPPKLAKELAAGELAMDWPMSVLKQYYAEVFSRWKQLPVAMPSESIEAWNALFHRLGFPVGAKNWDEVIAFAQQASVLVKQLAQSSKYSHPVLALNDDLRSTEAGRRAYKNRPTIAKEFINRMDPATFAENRDSCGGKEELIRHYIDILRNHADKLSYPT